MHSKKMRGNGCKLKQGKFRLDKRKKIVHTNCSYRNCSLKQVSQKDWGIFTLENTQNKWTRSRAAHVSSKPALLQINSRWYRNGMK